MTLGWPVNVRWARLGQDVCGAIVSIGSSELTILRVLGSRTRASLQAEISRAVLAVEVRMAEGFVFK